MCIISKAFRYIIFEITVILVSVGMSKSPFSISFSIGPIAFKTWSISPILYSVSMSNTLLSLIRLILNRQARLRRIQISRSIRSKNLPSIKWSIRKSNLITICESLIFNHLTLKVTKTFNLILRFRWMNLRNSYRSNKWCFLNFIVWRKLAVLRWINRN